MTRSRYTVRTLLRLVILLSIVAGSGLFVTSAVAQTPILLVLHKGGSSLGFYTMEGKLLSTVPLGSHPHEMVRSSSGRTLYVTENGCAFADHLEDGLVRDTQRIAYLRGHLAAAQRAIQEGVSTSGLDVVEATVLRRELLRAYVERLEPDDDVARERLYQRLKRQRSRAMQRLKSLLTTTSPIQLSIGF